MISLRHIEVFYAIMRAGTITEAARILNVSQPAVSVALKHFESRIGMRLFDRAGGRLKPTPEAKALLPDVAEIFGRLSAVERFSQDLAGGSRGLRFLGNVRGPGRIRRVGRPLRRPHGDYRGERQNERGDEHSCRHVNGSSS